MVIVEKRALNYIDGSVPTSALFERHTLQHPGVTMYVFIDRDFSNSCCNH